MVTVRKLGTLGPHEIRELGDVLIDCVEGGASVSFMAPMTREKADTFWLGVAEGVARGERIVVAARDDDGTLIGTAQVIVAQPENQPHRADVAKMLVRRSARRRGVGAALLAAAEAEAARAGKTLLVLDTASPDAERLYAANGWERCGVIPDYALLPSGEPCATIVFFKRLGGARR